MRKKIQSAFSRFGHAWRRMGIFGKVLYPLHRKVFHGAHFLLRQLRELNVSSTAFLTLSYVNAR